jgi:DnaJ-class molecular chaperone
MTTKICPSCRGNGIFSGLECDICGGFGRKLPKRGELDCAPCNGTIPDYPCHQCQGKGVVPDTDSNWAVTQTVRYVRK